MHNLYKVEASFLIFIFILTSFIILRLAPPSNNACTAALELVTT